MTTSDAVGPRETRIVEMVFPNQANHYGTLFGGDALRLMDMAAFVTGPLGSSNPVSHKAPTAARLPRALRRRHQIALVHMTCVQFSIGLNLSVTSIANKLGSPK